MSSGQESPSYAKDSIPDILGKDTNAVFSKLHDTFNKFFQWDNKYQILSAILRII